MRDYFIEKILLGTFYVLIFVFATINILMAVSGEDHEYASVFLARGVVGYAVLHYLKQAAKTRYIVYKKYATGEGLRTTNIVG